MEAVRVMTIHGSKGLEFRAVHFPSLATMYMPNSWRGVRISAAAVAPPISPCRRMVTRPKKNVCSLSGYLARGISFRLVG